LTWQQTGANLDLQEASNLVSAIEVVLVVCLSGHLIAADSADIGMDVVSKGDRSRVAAAFVTECVVSFVFTR